MQVSPLCKANDVVEVGKEKVAAKEERGVAVVDEEEGAGAKGQPELHQQHHQHQLSCDQNLIIT